MGGSDRSESRLELDAGLLGTDEFQNSFFDEFLFRLGASLDDFAETFQFLFKTFEFESPALLADLELLVDDLNDLLLDFLAIVFGSLRTLVLHGQLTRLLLQIHVFLLQFEHFGITHSHESHAGRHWTTGRTGERI
jgi:hypothetical protein